MYIYVGATLFPRHGFGKVMMGGYRHAHPLYSIVAIKDGQTTAILKLIYCRS